MSLIDSEFDTRNVLDHYKGRSTELIREDVQKHTFPYALCMSQLQGDFNISTLFRSGNALGARELFYYGKKKFDRRGLIGVQNYSKLTHLKSFESLFSLKEKYVFVGLELTDAAVDLRIFEWPEKPFMILIGEESCGLSKEVLDICDFVVKINQVGSVRSMNASVAGSIAMYDYSSKLKDIQNA